MSNFLNLYKYINKQWKTQAVTCLGCGKTIVRLASAKTHKCPVQKPKKRIKDDIMPIHKTQSGFWWGSKGPFPTKEKAEEVARAAYAHGYKQKKEEKKPK